jgi:hypothetical protein
MNADTLEVSLIIRDQRRGLCAIAKHVTGNSEDWTLETLPGLVREMARKATAFDELLKALPRCIGEYTGSGGHMRLEAKCPRIATWRDDGFNVSHERFCDEHAPEHRKVPGHADEIEDLPWADVVRKWEERK